MFKIKVGLDLKKLEEYSDWAYIVFLIIPLVLMYFRVLIGKTFFWDDALFLWYPYRHFAANCLREGIFPLWNPYLLGGAPFQADIQSALIYPFNLALTPFVYNGWLSTRAIQMVTILHVYLGGIFMFFLMKKSGLVRTGCNTFLAAGTKVFINKHYAFFIDKGRVCLTDVGTWRLRAMHAGSWEISHV